MKITFKGDYALKAVLDLALQEGKRPVKIHEMAKRIDAPVKFLEAILRQLKQGKVVQSRRGKLGGYVLSRGPGKITVGQVVRLIDGALEPIACVRGDYKDCADLLRCPFRDVWRKVDQATSDIVDHLTFEDLAGKMRAGEKAANYSI